MSSFLLDTDTLIWACGDAPQLSASARRILDETSADLYVSIASLWELAIKVSRGKIDLGFPFDEFVSNAGQTGVRFYGIEAAHTIKASELPFHHADPFDRMLIAQSLVSKWPVVSRDVAFDAYGVERIW